jgi:exosortase
MVSDSRLGFCLLLVAIGLRAAGTLLFLNYLDGLSFLVALLAVFGFAAGRPGVRWAAPAVAFLAFMLPLPFAVQTGMSGALQGVATRASTYVLVTCGSPAVAEGNTILLINDVRLGVVEACSGLGMLYAFLAIAVGAVLVIRSRPSWIKVTLILSTPIVAVAVNVGRIATTGLLYQAAEDRIARIVFHDVAGYLMMPAALVIFAAEIAILDRVVRQVTIPRGAVAAVAFGLRPAPPTAAGVTPAPR